MKREMRSPLSAGSRSRRFLLFLLSFLVLFYAWLPQAAVRIEAEDSPAVVKVGYFSNGGFMSRKEDGTYAGYDIEYYYTLAGYANWKLEIEDYPNLDSALEALERGDIDILSGLSRTPERESRYLVSSSKMCTSHISVQVRADDTRYSAGDTATMADIQCGILKGSNVIALYTNWCTENGLSPHVVEYDSLDLRNAALLSGEVDAIAAGSTIEGAQKIAEFPSLDLYFMLNRNRADLKGQLDRAMGILSLQSPSYTRALFDKYFPASRNSSPSFSQKEQQFIAAHPVIRIAMLSDDAPFSHLESNGKMTGFLPEYYAHLAEVIGNSIECVPCADADETFQAVQDGRADLIGKVEDNIFVAESRGVILTNPYLSMNLAEITKAGTASVSTAAVPRCNEATVSEILSAAGSAIAVQVCDNSEDCFEALKSGKADAVICSQPASSWLLTRNRSSEYSVSAFSGVTWDLDFGLLPNADGNMLRGIINKTTAVDQGYIYELISSDNLQDSADLSNFLNRLSVSAIVGISAAALVLLAIVTIALIIIIRSQKAEKKLAAKKAELAVAEEANRTRHAFFGAVSHDMRTPLNGILGFTDLAMKSSSPEEVRDYLGKIRASGTILSGLVNDTLAISRMETGGYTLNPAPTSLNGLLKEVSDPIRMQAENKGVIYEDRASAAADGYVMADRLNLQKILLNLLSNAVKYTPRGGSVTLGYHLEPYAPDGNERVFTVADTGRGISPAFLPHLFEPFAQEAQDTARNSGNGLGLSIVHQMVELMHGEIQVSSAPGKGSVFTVRLHLESCEAPAEDSNSLSKAAEALQGKRVLVCEDNALNLEIERTILEQNGMTVTTAENGRQGLELFEKSPESYYDFILLDLRMPVMDGLTAARRIRGLSRADAGSIPIFAVSADAFAENIQEAVSAGMSGHISKPINAEELVQKLADCRSS